MGVVGDVRTSFPTLVCDSSRGAKIGALGPDAKSSPCQPRSGLILITFSLVDMCAI